jgi:UDP-apiose/xylose synthase
VVGMNIVETREQKIFILGCGGFIGSHLLESLLSDERVEINGWDPDDSKIGHLLGHPRLRFRHQHFRDSGSRDEIEQAVEEVDVVVNLAALCNPAEYNTNPLITIERNFSEVLPLVQLCAKHKKWIIHFSTSEVYGRTIASYIRDNDYSDSNYYEFDEDTTPLIMGPIVNQRWTYAAAKQLFERVIYAQHKEAGMNFTIIRPFNFFGPRMDYIPGREGDGVPRVLACFMSALLNGTPMQLVDGGRSRRSILSIHDAVATVRLMLERPENAKNEIFNIGSRENEVTIAELANVMRNIYADITGDPGYRAHPLANISGEEFYGEGYEDCDRRVPNLDKATRLLGWTPERSIDEILRETIAYYHDLYGKGSRCQGFT